MKLNPPLLLFGHFEDAVHVHGHMKRSYDVTFNLYCQGVVFSSLKAAMDFIAR